MTLTARSGAADPFAHQMLGPWYSGMAQGIALSSYARLAQLTEDDTFRDRADQVWQTLTISRERSDPWATVVDDDGHYWIEEWPQIEPTHALNGKIFGIYGLYEYWLHTGRDDVEHAVQASLATITEMFDQYRVPGEASRYCLGHGHQNKTYHHIHRDLCLYLDRMVGSNKFGEMAALLTEDYWDDELAWREDK